MKANRLTRSASAAATPHAPAPQVFSALLWMAVALASFTMVAITGRIAGQGTDTMHVMFYRSAISLVIITVLISLSKEGFRHVSFNRVGLHTVRNIIHFAAQFSWLSALMLIPLAQLFAIEFTAPLWVAVLAPLLLAERLTVTRIIAAIIGFVGIIVIVQPGVVTISAGTVFAMMAALGFAGAMISTKKLVRTDTIFCILFHMSWMQLLIAGISLIGNLTLPPFQAFIGIIGVAVAGMMAHYALTRAFTHADAIIVAPMDFLRLPLIMVVGVILYGEPIQQSVLIGGAIVVGANLINILGERYRSSRL